MVFWKGKPAGSELKDKMKKHTVAINEMKGSIDDLVLTMKVRFAGGAPPPTKPSGSD